MKDIIDQYTYTFKLYNDGKIIENLITVLEMLFLNKNDSKYKKESLSKRVSVFLGNDDAETKNIYLKVKEFYKIRSDSTHEGKISNIELETNDTKELVRKTLLKYLMEVENSCNNNEFSSFKQYKNKKISNLKKTVSEKDSIIFQ